MNRQEWDQIIRDLYGHDVDRAVKAIGILDQKTDVSDVPALYNLLGDPSFFIREAAASPLAALEGAKALPRLLEALTQGQADGHDNDTLVAIIVDLLEEHPAESLPIVLKLLRSSNKADRINAAWAIGFLKAVTSSQPLLEFLMHEQDPDIRSVAMDSLSNL